MFYVCVHISRCIIICRCCSPSHFSVVCMTLVVAEPSCHLLRSGDCDDLHWLGLARWTCGHVKSRLLGLGWIHPQVESSVSRGASRVTRRDSPAITAKKTRIQAYCCLVYLVEHGILSITLFSILYLDLFSIFQMVLVQCETPIVIAEAHMKMPQLQGPRLRQIGTHGPARGRGEDQETRWTQVAKRTHTHVHIYIYIYIYIHTYIYIYMHMHMYM